MRTKLSVSVVLSLIAIGFLAGGCKSDSMSMSSDTSKGAVLVMHDGVTKIYTVGQGGLLTTYYSTNAQQCAQCDADVKAYYMTGHIDPVCKMCGATRTVIPYQAPSSSGHQ